MMGPRQQREGKLFYTNVNLDERVPENHPLRKIAQAVDFSFIRREVAGLYGVNGHESLDPTLTLKLCFLCFYENVRSERELMRQLPLRLDWLWFCELDLDSSIPDPSVLSKARQRWGERVFEKLFAHVLKLCQDAGLVEGRTEHADSTLLKASAALDKRVSRKLWEQLEAAQGPKAPAEAPAAETAPAGPAALPAVPAVPEASDPPVAAPAVPADQPQPDQPQPDQPQPAKAQPAKLNARLVSPVDPDAATSTRKKGGTTLGYRDHRLIDDQHGIIVATVATAADVDDGAMLPALLERAADAGLAPHEVVGDSMYGTQANYQHLAAQGIKAYLKKRRGKDSPKVSWLKLLPAGCTPGRALDLLGRRKSRAEGSFAEAHERMNHRRCRWRRRQRVQTQCFLVASVQNVKKLVRYGGRKNAAPALAVARRAPVPGSGPTLWRGGRFTAIRRRHRQKMFDRKCH